MKTTYKIMKLRARQSLQGHYGTVVGRQILIGVFSMVFVFVFYAAAAFFLFLGTMLGFGERSRFFYAIGLFGLVAVIYFGMVIFSSLFGAGYTRMFLEIAQARPVDVGDVFYAFKNRGIRFVGLVLLQFLIQIAVGLPFGMIDIALTLTRGYGNPLVFLLGYVPALWVLLQYSQAMCLMIENPDRKIVECLRGSRRMMQGNKFRLFLLWMSFLGWIPLIYLSMGIGALWVMPYMLCTLAHFYLSVRMEQQYGEYGEFEERDNEEWTNEL